MKHLVARVPTAWRWVGLGLLVSAAGAVGIVNLASARPLPVPPGAPGEAPRHGPHDAAPTAAPAAAPAASPASP